MSKGKSKSDEALLAEMGLASEEDLMELSLRGKRSPEPEPVPADLTPINFISFRVVKHSPGVWSLFKITVENGAVVSYDLLKEDLNHIVNRRLIKEISRLSLESEIQ